MSFDLNVLLCSAEFPESDNWSLLSDFGETTEQETDMFGRHSTTHIDESSIFCSVRELTEEDGIGFQHNFKWRVGVFANTGCTPRARWAQFALPFRWLVLSSNATAYDPQSGTFISDADLFLEFAQKTFQRWPQLPRQLRGLELVSEGGEPRF